MSQMSEIATSSGRKANQHTVILSSGQTIFGNRSSIGENLVADGKSQECRLREKVQIDNATEGSGRASRLISLSGGES